MEILYTNDIPNNFTGIVRIDGEELWFKEGKLHREDGPAREFVDGRKEWYKNGKLHREDGPAVEGLKGRKEWLIEGQWHREDGPAIVHPIVTPDTEIVDESFYLKGILLTTSYFPTNLNGCVVLSKDHQHPLYPLVKIWKILDKEKIFDLQVIPGMEKYIWV